MCDPEGIQLHMETCDTMHTTAYGNMCDPECIQLHMETCGMKSLRTSATCRPHHSVALPGFAIRTWEPLPFVGQPGCGG